MIDTGLTLYLLDDGGISFYTKGAGGQCVLTLSAAMVQRLRKALVGSCPCGDGQVWQDYPPKWNAPPLTTPEETK